MTSEDGGHGKGRCGEGHDAVCHMEEDGGQLVAFRFDIQQGVVEAGAHVVEGAGEGADLVLRLHLDLLGEITSGHVPGRPGQALDGPDHGLGQEEGKQHADGKADHQGLQNDGEHVPRQGRRRLPVVPDADDIAARLPPDGHRHVHIVGGHAAGIALRAGEGGDDVGGQAEALTPVGGIEQLPRVAGEDVEGAGVLLDAQGAGIGVEDLRHAALPLLVGGGAQLLHEARVGKSALHLVIELL